MMTPGKLTAAVICGLTLTACGGGSDSSVQPPTVSYTVTPSVSGNGGTIGPAAATPVASGATISFTLAPDSGYIAGPVSGTCGGTLDGNTYTTAAVTADCTVVATFKSSSAVRTFSYEAQPLIVETSARGPSDFLALLNQEGAKGYFYQSSWNTIYSLTTINNGLITFVNDGSGQTYSYEQLIRPDNITDFVAQANTEGANGYHYEKEYYAFIGPTGPIPFALYRKDNDLSATYTYVTDSSTTNAADLLAQANQQGQAGYLLYPYPPYTMASQSNLYVKNNASSSTYTYDAPTLPATVDDLFAQMNNEGAQGYFALSYYNMAMPVMVYVKDQTQAATFIYQSPAASAMPLDQDNSYGAQSYAYWGSITNIPSVSGLPAWYYVKASHCNGWMCTAPSPTANVAPPAPTNDE